MRCGVLLAALLLASNAFAQALNVTVLTDRLENPWGLAFLPDGRMLLTERVGRLWLLDAHGKKLVQVGNVPASFVKLQGGLFDVVLHPQFAANGQLYFSYLKPAGEQSAVTVARGRFDGSAVTTGVRPAVRPTDMATATPR